MQHERQEQGALERECWTETLTTLSRKQSERSHKTITKQNVRVRQNILTIIGPDVQLSTKGYITGQHKVA